MGYLKRYNMPKFWPVPLKKNVLVVKPSAGPHRSDFCMPLQVILRDALKLAGNAEEAKKIVNAGKILVDRKVRKDCRFPVGFMDSVELPDMGKQYRLLSSKKGLVLTEIAKEEAGRKICQILGKRTIKNGLTQINLHDGRNIAMEKCDYKIGDSVVIGLPEQNIIAHMKLEKGNTGLIFGGVNSGTKGKIKRISNRSHMMGKSTVTLSVGGKEIETRKDYVIVIKEGSKEEAEELQEEKKAKPKKKEKDG